MVHSLQQPLVKARNNSRTGTHKVLQEAIQGCSVQHTQQRAHCSNHESWGERLLSCLEHLSGDLTVTRQQDRAHCPPQWQEMANSYSQDKSKG